MSDELRRRIDAMSCSVPGDPNPWQFEDLVYRLVLAARAARYRLLNGLSEDMPALDALQEALKPFEDCK